MVACLLINSYKSLPEWGAYLISAGKITLVQLALLLGPLLVLAFLMNLVAQINERLSYRVLGRTAYLCLFGALGTAVHETSHALFALLFGHKIDEVKLFKPDPKTGTLGYVLHSYNRKNPYHLAGNFFIGIGPVIIGALLLFFLSYLLYRPHFLGIRFSVTNIHSLSSFKSETTQLWKGAVAFFHSVFVGDGARLWKTILFFYCLYSIGSSITLSTSDLKTSFNGLLIVVLLLLLFNIASLWVGDFAMNYILKINSILSFFYALMLLSVAINLAFVAVLAVVSGIKSMISR